MAYWHIQTEEADGVLLIALNEPTQRNALSLGMRAELAEAIAQGRDDDSVRAVVLTGRGGAFCAGGDLKSLREGADRAIATRHRIQGLHAWFADFVDFPKPVVVAVDGPCAGAGFSLAMAGDAILCTPRAWFCQIFGRIGVIPDMASLYLLPRRIGLPAARELIMTARRMGSDEALSRGFVNEIVPADRLESVARDVAARLADAAGEGFVARKQALNHAFERAPFHDPAALR
ncbi:probable enoyl-CoA hydratase [Pseudooceanicola batsensis HTCC2597]|uniref:Probable enoyl-CoA hydratase n=1 Tax=Pseudooceanicola batsensis (strain ATCC BAA-863 / DSM 15984 / KCTC 12145 / HTCC2597) TaxID=252305 RepID=A3TZF5_PSEBH|nr:enoyl-CoA hydratase/isomerase family protein [Pseudooceanicola batsensis]EAQ02436.1 probable enoyl-CoA hydratase [Pseudooceanicola batsensis HTCC2597]